MILCDFNAAVGTTFEVELLEMCRSLNLLISDYNVYGRDSEQYTYLSDAHYTTSWLDHILCSHDMNVKLKSLGILDKLPSSDHLPMFADLLFVSFTLELNICSTYSDEVTFNWCKASDYDILHYRNLTFVNISMIPVLHAMKCNDIKCKLPDHRHQIDSLYSQICCSLKQSSIDSIPSSKVHDCRDYIVLGFNEFVNELHSDAYVAGRDAGRPRSGSFFSDMKRSRLRFRYTLRHCRQDDQSIRANMHAKAYLEKDVVSFSKGMKKENISRLPLPSKVDNCV